jgi:hypothetical protein
MFAKWPGISRSISSEKGKGNRYGGPRAGRGNPPATVRQRTLVIGLNGVFVMHAFRPNEPSQEATAGGDLEHNRPEVNNVMNHGKETV